MNGTDRRMVLRVAAASALAALGATRAFGSSPLGGTFAPPLQPMRFTRVLERTMSGGHHFRVEREFAVRFAPQPGGYAIAGTQTGVDVEAPDLLADFARLERERVEAGLFPLRLDASGRIADTAKAAPREQLEAALKAARAVIAQNPPDAQGMAEAAQFMALVHSSAASFLSHLPADLFAPAEARRVEERALDLPGGAGLVRVEFVAEEDPLTGVMRRARREIVTTIEGQSRTTREDWTLAPLAA